MTLRTTFTAGALAYGLLLISPSCANTPSAAARIERWQSVIGVARAAVLTLVDHLHNTPGPTGAPILDDALHQKIVASVQHAAEAITQGLAAWRAATGELPPPPASPPAMEDPARGGP